MITGATSKEILPKNVRLNKLVLVVNDTQEILDLFKDIFEEEGFDVLLSSYAPQELEEIIAIDPDLVVLDFIIGDEAQGWQLLQKMKMNRSTESIPAIVCSGAVSLIKDLEGHLLAKNVGVILKPFDIDDLLGTVKMVLANRTPHEIVHPDEPVDATETPVRS